MSDDNKTFKFKTIELFGKHYTAKHISFSSLNNRFLIVFGFIKYYYLKFYNRKFIPLMHSCGFLNISDFVLFLFICSVFYFFFAFFFAMTTAEAEHNKLIDSCIENACSIIEKHCKNKEKVILRYCVMDHISMLPLIKTQYYIFNGWIVYIITRSVLGIFIFGLLFNFTCYLYNKIPEIEEKKCIKML